MKIIFLNRFFYPDQSATSQLLADLAFFLADHDLEVCVITSRQAYEDPHANLSGHERVRGVDILRVATTRFGRGNLPGRALDYLSFYLSATRAAWRMTRRGDVLVAMTDPPMISVCAAMVARRRGARLVNWLQDIFPEIAAKLGVKALVGPVYALLHRLRNRSLTGATNVVLGQGMAAVLARDGVAPGSIQVIPNWADSELVFPVDARENPLRKQWGLDGRFVVCYSGNMGRAHEFDTILEAAGRLATSLPAACFVFIGSGKQREAIETAARQRGLDNVMFKPYQERAALSQSLGVGDVHLVSLRPELEGYIVPSKFYGIAAAGRPVIFIGDPEGEIGSIVRQEKIGVAVRQGDAAALAGQLTRLAENRSMREDMGRRARDLLCNRYDQKKMLTRWLSLLR